MRMRWSAPISSATQLRKVFAGVPVVSMRWPRSATPSSIARSREIASASESVPDSGWRLRVSA
jgi:hypothetical protein